MRGGVDGSRFTLRPELQTTHLFKYLLALYAAKHGMQLHSCCLRSSHHHVVFTGARGNRGGFFRDFHAAITRCLQVYRGLGRSYVFDKGETSQMDVVTSAGVIEAFAYALANPVAAGITSEPSAWPGNLINLAELATGRTEIAKRPDTFRHERGHVVRYFDLTGDAWPETVELRFEPVPMLEAEGSGADQYQGRVRAEVQRLIQEKVAEGGSFSGVTRALRRSIKHTSKQNRPFGERSPRVKAGSGQSEARIAALRVLREFWAHHAQAVADIKAGRSAVFPRGTYRWVRVFDFPIAT